jgi:beta-alanine--pyruvate transaminase
MHSLKGLPHVIDIRTIGLIAGIELQSRDGAIGARAYDVFVDCFEKGLLIRVTGDIIAFSPPLIAEEKHFGEIVSILGDALKRAK